MVRFVSSGCGFGQGVKSPTRLSLSLLMAVLCFFDMPLEKNHCTGMCVFNPLSSTLDVTCRLGTPRQDKLPLPPAWAAAAASLRLGAAAEEGQPGAGRGPMRTQNPALGLARA